jgi:imidazolonepropionase-like amidohydrolase
MLSIRAARLFDGDTLHADPIVVIEDGTILSTTGPATGHVTDLGEVTLIPGMIDAHIHLSFDASPDPVAALAARTDGEVLAQMRSAAHTALLAGVTTVRDLGDRGYLALRLRTEFTADPAGGPHILSAGPPITTPRGHCWYLGGETEGVQGVVGAVRERAARGCDVIKVMATGGELTMGTLPYQPQFTLAELTAITTEAARLGIPTTAHAHGAAGIGNAIAAGFQVIEHCSFLTERSAELDYDVFAALKQSDVVISATLGHLPGYQPTARVAAVLARLTSIFGELIDAGLNFIVSSDAGISPAKPHSILAYSASHFTQLGATPLHALRAITSLAAKACRVDDRKGHLAPGFDADLVAVPGNPLTDITTLREPTAVYRLGHRVR